MRRSTLTKGDGPRRTTIVLTEIQDHNIDLLSLEKGVPKSELIREAIDSVLKKNGYSTTEKMKFKVDKSS